MKDIGEDKPSNQPIEPKPLEEIDGSAIKMKTDVQILPGKAIGLECPPFFYGHENAHCLLFQSYSLNSFAYQDRAFLIHDSQDTKINDKFDRIHIFGVKSLGFIEVKVDGIDQKEMESILSQVVVPENRFACKEVIPTCVTKEHPEISFVLFVYFPEKSKKFKTEEGIMETCTYPVHSLHGHNSMFYPFSTHSALSFWYRGGYLNFTEPGIEYLPEYDQKKILTISLGFLNGDGGVLCLGIDPKIERLAGIEIQDTSLFRQKLDELMRLIQPHVVPKDSKDKPPFSGTYKISFRNLFRSWNGVCLVCRKRYVVIIEYDVENREQHPIFLGPDGLYWEYIENNASILASRSINYMAHKVETKPELDPLFNQYFLGITYRDPWSVDQDIIDPVVAIKRLQKARVSGVEGPRFQNLSQEASVKKMLEGNPFQRHHKNVSQATEVLKRALM